MDQGDGWFVASLLNSLFRKRPGCALSAFLAILVSGLGWMLLSAKKQTDLAFPVLGLAFIVLLVVIRAGGVLLRRWRGEPEHPEETFPDDEDEALATHAAAIPAAIAAAHGEDERHTAMQPRAGRPGFFTRAAPALLGSVGAIVTVLPSACLVGITLPTATHDESEALGYLIGLAWLALTPLAAVLGALVGWAAARIARASHPGAPVPLMALLAGAGAGLLVTALAFAAYARTCGWSTSCLM